MFYVAFVIVAFIAVLLVLALRRRVAPHANIEKILAANHLSSGSQPTASQKRDHTSLFDDSTEFLATDAEMRPGDCWDVSLD